ncbi:MAG: hypothetical protein AAFW82_07035 [Pseudomonadota bacterium]
MFDYFVMRRIVCQLSGAMVIGVLAAPAFALETPDGDKEKLRECGNQLCEMILNKEAAGDDLSCSIGQTWKKAKLDEGATENNLAWSSLGLGDARCTIEFKLKRQEIVDAATKPSADVVADKHAIKCQIETGEDVTDITLDIAPKMSFKDGSVEKIWLNVSNVKAPSVIQGVIVSAGWLGDSIGLFHSEMVKETNRFIQKCQKTDG